MTYHGKEVYTRETFRFDKAQIGDYVDQELVDDFMDMLPPACMSTRCSQIGEPYSHRQDPDTGKRRATYATFKRVSGEYPNGIWQYCGNCFRGETVERGKGLSYFFDSENVKE